MPAASAAVGGTRRFVDISVPRNISASVNELEGAARVFNVDDLKEVRHSSARPMCWPALRRVFVGALFFCSLVFFSSKCRALSVRCHR